MGPLKMLLSNWTCFGLNLVVEHSKFLLSNSLPWNYFSRVAFFAHEVVFDIKKGVCWIFFYLSSTVDILQEKS